MAKSRNYELVGPVLQQDPTCCWAASLVWWAKATGRPSVNQGTLVIDYDHLTNHDESSPLFGTVSRANLKIIFGDARWAIDCEEIIGTRFVHSYVEKKSKSGPLIVGYFEPELGGNHVNAVFIHHEYMKQRKGPAHAIDIGLTAMDPAYGAFICRNYWHYGTSAQLLVAWPRY